MITKLENMLEYDVDGELKKYVSHMKEILIKFI